MSETARVFFNVDLNVEDKNSLSSFALCIEVVESAKGIQSIVKDDDVRWSPIMLGKPQLPDVVDEVRELIALAKTCRRMERGYNSSSR